MKERRMLSNSWLTRQFLRTRGTELESKRLESSCKSGNIEEVLGRKQAETSPCSGRKEVNGQVDRIWWKKASESPLFFEPVPHAPSSFLPREIRSKLQTSKLFTAT